MNDTNQKLSTLLLNASNGDIISQLCIGKRFEEGNGLEQSYTAAFFWYSLASDDGSAQAQFNIAHLYEYGLGVDESVELAARWYSMSAESGFVEAQLKMGMLCEQGLGMKKSPEEAFQWYKKAADNGNSDAQYNLASMYEWGNGVEQSLDLAKQWYKTSADHGNSHSSLALLRLEKRTYPNDQKTVESKSSELTDKSAKELFEDAMRYESGELEDASNNCVKLLFESAKLGYAPAQAKLGSMFVAGDRIEQSYEEAIKWLTKATEQDDSEALYELGRLYEWGNGVDESIDKAIDLYKRAKDLGNKYAATSLSILQSMITSKEDESGHIIDPTIKNLIRNAESGDVRAQYELGVILEDGVQVPKDINQAIQWYRVASLQGSKEAKERLSALNIPELTVDVNISDKSGFNRTGVIIALQKARELQDLMNATGAYENEDYVEEPKEQDAVKMEPGWDNFIKALNPIQMEYLKTCLMNEIWNNRNGDPDLLEEDINNLCMDAIGDTVVESGKISEDHIIELKEVLEVYD